jgi:hypothetical protein
LLQAAASLLVLAIVAETVVALFIAAEVIVAVCRQFFHLFVLAHRTRATIAARGVSLFW